MPKIKRILVPVDFSEPSLQGLDFAAELARALGAQVELLYVVETTTYAPMMGVAADLRRIRERQEHAALERLEKLTASLRRRGLRCGAAIKLGVPVHTIVDVAAQGGFDLIVMATHGRHGVERLFVGSVAERVVRSAGCPVLTVRGGKRRTRRPRAKRRGAARRPTRSR